MSSSFLPHGLQHQASLCFTVLQCLLKFMSIESVMLSNHLILCHPLLFLSSKLLLSLNRGHQVRKDLTGCFVPWFSVHLTRNGTLSNQSFLLFPYYHKRHGKRLRICGDSYFPSSAPLCFLLFGIYIIYDSKDYIKIHSLDWHNIPYLPSFFWISDYVSGMVTRSVSQDILGEEEIFWVKEKAMKRQAGLGTY